jgi:hypothetical protein
MKRLSRREMLRAAGVALALPCLDAMARAEAPKRRMVLVNLALGLHGPHFFPEAAGRDYAASPYLKVLQDFRSELTVFSGLSHPAVDGGHFSEKSFLTAAPHPAGAGFKNTISLDQFAAMKLGLETRVGYLALSTGGRGISWSRSGALIPSESRPSRVFSTLFLEGRPEEKKRQLERLKDGQSVLDVVRDQLGDLKRRLGAADGSRLDEYTDAVRETEGRLHQAEAWEEKAKPAVDAKPPRDINDSKDVTGRARLLYDVLFLALQTDSTRIATLNENGANAVPPIAGVTQDYHNLSHHGLDPGKIEQLAIVEKEQLRIFADFLARLKAAKEGEATLLDRTMVLFGSNLGNASSHDTRNLPIVLAGGGFRHGQHLAFDRERNYPLCNLFVSMLRRLGIDEDSFGSSTGTMRGLDPA